MNTIRVNKLLSKNRLCSLREANHYIRNGMVQINDKIITSKLYEFQPNEHEDNVNIDLTDEGKQFKLHNNHISIIHHKPEGVVCNRTKHGYTTARDMLIPQNQWSALTKKDAVVEVNNMTLDDYVRFNDIKNKQEDNQQDHDHSKNTGKYIKPLHLVGRLDINTSGLLLFTQDGTLIKRANPHPHSNITIEKEFILGVKKHNIPQSWVNKCIKEYITYHNKNNDNHDTDIIKSCTVLNPYQLNIVLSLNGSTLRNSDILSDLCRLANFKLRSVKLVRVGELKLGLLPTGCWRYFIPGVDQI